MSRRRVFIPFNREAVHESRGGTPIDWGRRDDVNRRAADRYSEPGVYLPSEDNNSSITSHRADRDQFLRRGVHGWSSSSRGPAGRAT